MNQSIIRCKDTILGVTLRKYHIARTDASAKADLINGKNGMTEKAQLRVGRKICGSLALAAERALLQILSKCGLPLNNSHREIQQESFLALIITTRLPAILPD